MKHALIHKGMSECALAKVRYSQSYKEYFHQMCKVAKCYYETKSDVAIIIEDYLKYAITLT